MLNRRIAAIEKRHVGLGGPTEKKLRQVVVFDDDPAPQAAPVSEAPEKIGERPQAVTPPFSARARSAPGPNRWFPWK